MKSALYNYRDGVEGGSDAQSFSQETSQSDIGHSVGMMSSVNKELMGHFD